MIRILFLAANPKDMPMERLGEEIQTIEERVCLSKMRDLFEVRQRYLFIKQKAQPGQIALAGGAAFSLAASSHWFGGASIQ